MFAAVACVAALAAFVGTSSASSAQTPAQPRIAAAAWYLVGDDGAVLATNRARQRRAMASITKLMTAVVTLEHTKLSEVVTVSPAAAGIGESTAFLRPGERLTVVELLRAMLVASANDAALALALHVGGGSMPRFVALMNAKAEDLGLTDTSYRNPHGLDAPGHFSSARDATLLLRHALGIPFVRDAIGRTEVVRPGGRRLPATDDLVASWPRMIGGKTGHTERAGWSETGAATARGVTVFGTIMGSSSRAERNAALRSLLEHGLSRYRTVRAIDSSRVYAEVATGYGRPSVELVATRPSSRTVRDDESLVERVVAPTSVTLPVARGSILGRVEIWHRDRLVATSSLVAASDVREPGFLGKVAWFAQTTVANLAELVT